MMNISKAIILLIITSCLIYSCSSDKSTPINNPNFIQFRMVEDSTDITAPFFKIEATGEMIQLEEKILLNLNDVKNAEIRRQEGRDNVDVLLNFTAEGTEKFSQITGDNIGKKLGIMVEDKLIMTPVIMARIEVGKALVYYDIPENDAKQKVEFINEILKQR